MLKDVLKEIGLTEGESKVYIALLETGSTTTGKITKSCGISGSKIYEVLDRLKKKGLVTFVIKNGVHYFEATKPKKILDYLGEKEKTIKEQKQSIKHILPELIKKHSTVPGSEVKVFTGFEGLKTANEDIITTLKKGEEWLSMGLTEQPQSWEVYFTKRQKIRAQKGIHHKHLLNQKYKSLHKKRKNFPHTWFRFLPEDFEMPTSTEVYADKIIIMILVPENPFAVMVKSKAVADSFKKYFYALWKQAKK